MPKNIYERVLSEYSKDIDDGRVFLYNNMPLLMRKNPLLRIKNNTYTKDDILSEAFLLADNIILREDLKDDKKISKLWYLFNRGWGYLYNKINQYGLESYTIDDIRDSEHRSYDMDIDILDYVLVANNIITPLESQILQYLWQWRWKYEIARLMKTSYYNIKSIVETIALKIRRFIKENDLDDADNGEMNS